MRSLEWRWDPDPDDTTYVVDYAFLLRENEQVRVVRDRHVEGLFPQTTWEEAFHRAGLSVTSAVDEWNRVVFIARRRNESLS